MDSITASEMAELDRVMIEELGIDVPIMMEHAALAVAKLAATLTEGHITILAGHGNNGGDGLAAARHLHIWGYDVDVYCATSRDALKKDPAKQAAILERMKVPVHYNASFFEPETDLIIDALLGYNLEGNPRENYAALIEKANQSGVKILAVDIPSGLNATTGESATPCIKATATLTLSVAKSGLLKAPSVVGDISVGYMSVPKEVFDRFNVNP